MSKYIKTYFLLDENNNSLIDEINNRLFMKEEERIMINTDRLLITSLDQITAYNNANELEFILDELQDSTISNTQDNTDITGKGGTIIGTLKRNKAVTISGNNGYVVGGAMAAQTGSDVETGSFTVRTMDILTVSDNSVTLTNEPEGSAGAEIIALYKKEANGSLGQKFEQDATASATGKFSYATKAITFYEGDLEDGDQVAVFYDMEVTEAARVTNDANTYSKTLRLYIDFTCQDNCDNVYHGQFFIPRADFTGNFDIALGTDATVQSYECRSLKNNCGLSDAGKLWDYTIW